LSEAYYEGKKFVWKGKDYGILDQATFEKMQTKIWAEYEILFDEENKKLPAEEQIPEDEYNTKDENNKTGTEKAEAKINALEKDNIDLKLK
jgi:hypothetical protein